MEEVVIKVDVELEGSIAEVKDLKQQFAEAEDAVFKLAGAGKKNTKEFRDAALKAAELKQEVDNINTSLDDLKPDVKLAAFGKTIGGLSSGFAAATGAAALLGGESEDLQKTLVKVQAAMAFSEGIRGLADLKEGFKLLKIVLISNPIFLVATAIAAIGGAMFALRNNIPFLADGFKAIGKVISDVIAQLKTFSDWLGLSEFKVNELKKTIIKNNEKIIRSNTERYDREIREAERAGKFTEDLQIKRAKAVLEANKKISESLDKTNEEDKVRIEEIRVANIELTQTILDLEDVKADRKRDQRLADKEQAEADKLEAEEKRLADEALAIENDLLEATKARDKKIAELALDQEFIDLAAEMQLEADTAEAERKQAAADLDKKFQEEKIKTALMAFDTAKNISNAIFSIKLGNVVKGSAEEEKVLKKQFNVNKAFQLANAVINGAQALVAAQTVPFPLNVAQTALVVATTASSVAKISSSKFSGSSKSAPTPSTPSATASVGGASPSVSKQAPSLAQTGSTQLNPDGTVNSLVTQDQRFIKAVVVESDITGSQNDIRSIEEKATFG
tara:strand:- start:3229 stop:4917 length:1689 start_codon:yes stop_codon:yes gene_type:complete